MQTQFHFAKIISPIGWALAKETILSKVIANIDGFRLSLSNWYDDSKRKFVDTIMKLDNSKTIMLELKWPETRTKNHNPLTVTVWQEIKIGFSEFFEDAEDMLFTDFLDIESLPIGAKLYFDESQAELTVSKNEKSTDGLVTATVSIAGTINSDMMIYFRDYEPHITYVTERDRRDILWAINNGIHTIVLAHTRNSENIDEVRHFLALNDGKQMKIFFRVQNVECINNYEEILASADGVIIDPVTYWDVTEDETHLHDKIYGMIEYASSIGKPMIMHFSVHELGIDHKIRSDKLSEYLEHGMMCLQFDDDIIDLEDPTMYIEETFNMMHEHQWESTSNITLDQARITEEYKTTDYIVYSAYRAIKDIDVKAIIIYTENWYTATMLSAYRPNIPVIAFTKNDAAYRYINLLWAVRWYKISNAFDYHNIKQLGKEIIRIIFKGSISLEDKILIVHASNINVEMWMINWLEIYKFKDI